MSKTYYKRNLPHLLPKGATFFVTFRLADALPQLLVNQLKEEFVNNKQQILKENKPNSKQLIIDEQKRLFGKYEAQLDTNPYGKCWLKEPDIAQIVANKLQQYNQELYNLCAYCIMPNHVHVLLDFSLQLYDEKENLIEEEELDYVNLSKLLGLIKGGTAFQINKLLKRKGAFWQEESYDHYIRNEK